MRRADAFAATFIGGSAARPFARRRVSERVTPHRCRLCGEPLDEGVRSCPIGLEPIDRPPVRRTPTALLRAIASAALFLATLPLFLAPSARLADPMTILDVRALPGHRFPIVIVTADAPRVVLERVPWHIAPPPRGSSYLVGAAHSAESQRRLNAALAGADAGSWRLHVEELGRDRERIELTFVQDSYDGSIYEATATSIRPLQRRFTGPGFGIVVGFLALAMNAAAWIIAWIAWRLIGRRRKRDAGSRRSCPCREAARGAEKLAAR